jgi:hypothetical protein
MLRRTLWGLLTVVAFTACDSTEPQGTSRLSVLLTDAQGDVTQAVVKIDRLELVGGSGGPLLLDDSGWIGDLTELTNEFVGLVEDVVIPNGSYSQLRVIISEACIGVQAGEGADDDVYVSQGASEVLCEGTEVGELHMPSLSETGIKVIFQGPIQVAGGQKILLIDFDVAESFGKEAGGSERWVMNPTIHGIELEFSSSVNLTVELGTDVTLDGKTFEEFTASLGSESQTLVTDGDVGRASFLFVVPGDYDLDLTPPGGYEMTTTSPVPIEGLTVDPGAVENVTITIDSFGAVTP